MNSKIDDNSQTVNDVVALIPQLRAYGRSLTRNTNDADDLVQETLTKAFANIGSFRPGTMLRAWLFTIMRNSFFTEIRKRQREKPGVEDCVSSVLSVSATQETHMMGREIQAAIERLPVHYREILVLVLVLGESYEDAARICDCAVGTVKSRVNRARNMIIADLEK